jgi:hypothetical protein
MLMLARQRAKDLPVEFIEADVFAWQPPRRYDTVFFAFWLTPSWLSRQRRRSGLDLLTAAITGWSRSTTGRVS